MDKFLKCNSAEKVDVCRVVVQKSRDVSEALTKKIGVRHESPQILLIRSGQCIWNTSHRSITADKLIGAIENE